MIWLILALVLLFVGCTYCNMFDPSPHENSSARVIFIMAGIPLLLTILKFW